MPLIEGIGDEVVQFFACVSISLLIIAAWFSTKVRRRHSCRVCTLCRLIVSQWLQQTRTAVAMAESLIEPVTDSNNAERQQAEVAQSQTSETDSANVIGNESTNASAAGTSTSQISRDGESLQQKLNNDQTQLDLTNQQEPKRPSCPPSDSDMPMIKIKLKHLNESIKIADAKLDEKLGEFKRRVFSVELSQGRRVLLLFNGRILQSDQQTLAACGFFDNCVVHCLIRQGSSRDNPSTARPQSRPRRAVPAHPSPPERGFSLVLFPMFGIILIGIWYSHYRYSQLFSFTATFGLLLLTGLYLAFLFGSVPLEPQGGIVPVA